MGLHLMISMLHLDSYSALGPHTNCLLHLRKWERQGGCGERDREKAGSKQNIGLL